MKDSRIIEIIGMMWLIAGAMRAKMSELYFYVIALLMFVISVLSAN